MAKEKTIPSVLADYTKVLQQKKALKEKHSAEIAKIAALQEKMEAWLLAQDVEVEVSEEIKELSPFIAWKLEAKTEGSAITCHMKIDDEVIPLLENSVDAEVKALKDQLKQVENWALQRLVEGNMSNFSAKGLGRAQVETVNRYNIADKKLLVDWAHENGNEDLLSITIRQNSKAMADILEEAGSLPPGVSSYSENKVKFVKA